MAIGVGSKANGADAAGVPGGTDAVGVAGGGKGGVDAALGVRLGGLSSMVRAWPPVAAASSRLALKKHLLLCCYLVGAKHTPKKPLSERLAKACQPSCRLFIMHGTGSLADVVKSLRD